MRQGARARGYDRTWARLRASVLRDEPLCRVRGCGRRAEHVDHIVAIALAPQLRLERGNLQPLCAYHHRLLTVAYDSGSIRGVCDAAGQPLDPSHPWLAADNTGALAAVAQGKRPRPQLIASLKLRAVKGRG
jgi:hypothetical protein